MSSLVAVARVVGIFGNKGSLKVLLLTDFPSRLLELQDVKLVGKETQDYRIVEARKHGRGFVLTLSGVDTVQKAKDLIGCHISVPEEEVKPLPQDTYYEYQLVGLDAYDEAGERIGEVEEILELPANDVLVIDRNGKEVLVPVVAAFIKKIDMENKRIVIAPIKGLIDQE
jgi:16S rRNA processing protein RimM